jgi:hypothetical protein
MLGGGVLLLFFWDEDFEALWFPFEEVISSGSRQFRVANWLVCVYVYEYWLG